MTGTQSLSIQQPVRTSRRVSMSSEKALSTSFVKPSFEPYPSQSVPLSMNSPTTTKKKVRRPSETAPVLCQHCGKNYKHQQCLVKHLWEHSPYWGSIPNSQPLSKHQKVQLLETASILYKLSGSPNPNADHSISPSPFGTSQLSSSDYHSRGAGIILEADDEEDDEMDSGEGDSSPRATSSEAVDDDEEQEIFGSMDQ